MKEDGRANPAQVVATDCEEVWRVGQDRAKQRMRDERGLSLCNLLHCDGVYLPTLHQQYPPSMCVCVCMCVASRTVMHYLPCYLFVTVLHKNVKLEGSKQRITAAVSHTEGEFLFGLRLDRGPGLCYTCHVTRMLRGSSDTSDVCRSKWQM